MFLSATWVLNLGGDKRDRTADLLNTIQARSQLSYTPTSMNPLIPNGFVAIQFSFRGFLLGPSTGGCALPAELYPRSWFLPCGFNFLWNKAWLNCWILILFWFLIALFPSFSNSIQVSFLDFKVVQLRRQIKKLGQHWIFITNQGR